MIQYINTNMATKRTYVLWLSKAGQLVKVYRKTPLYILSVRYAHSIYAYLYIIRLFLRYFNIINAWQVYHLDLNITLRRLRCFLFIIYLRPYHCIQCGSFQRSNNTWTAHIFIRNASHLFPWGILNLVENKVIIKSYRPSKKKVAAIFYL